MNQASAVNRLKILYSIHGNPSQRATEHHIQLPNEITMLPATWHRWTCPTLIPARQADTRFTYAGGMEGW